MTKTERDLQKDTALPTRGNEKIDDLIITISVDATWDNSHLPVVRPYLFLTLMSQDHYKKEYRKVSKTVTVRELQDMVMKLFCTQSVGDISLFATSDLIEYVKVGPNKDVSVGEVLSDNQTVCYLEDKCDYKNCWPVKHGNVEIGNVYGYLEDTAKIIQIRVQDHLDIPAYFVYVTDRSHRLHPAQYQIGDKQINIDVLHFLSLHEYKTGDKENYSQIGPYLF